MAAEPQRGTLEEFRRRRTKQLLITGVAIPVIFALFWLREHPSQGLAGLSAQSAAIVLFAVMLGLVVFSLGNWRCPACSGYLGKGINPKFCARCGAQLRA
jgi:hypothetical protein